MQDLALASQWSPKDDEPCVDQGVQYLCVLIPAVRRDIAAARFDRLLLDHEA